MEPKRAIFIDLDGTLLKGLNPKLISKKNIQYLKKLQHNNIYVVICTGRSRKPALEAQNIIRANEFGDYIIYSGGTVFENTKTKQIIYQGSISKEDTKKVAKIAIEHNFALKIDGIDLFFVNRKIGFKVIFKIIGLKLRPMDKLVIVSKSNKIGMLSTKNRTRNEEIRQSMIKKHPMFDIHISGKGFYFELTPKGFNKGEMIKKACAYLKVSLNNTAGIGDSMNDYEMMKVVEYPILMKNGTKKLKEVTKYTTSHCKFNGVANSEKYLNWLK